MTAIRKSNPNDAVAIADVHMQSRREAMPWLPKIHTESETQWWIEHSVLPNQDVWVAEADDRIVGFAARDGDMLEQLYVLPGYQGRGIGSDLLRAARMSSTEALRLWTFQRNTAARKFYERHGFRAVRFTDGTGNEEREPDVLYARSDPKPILFVDIDGVLNTFGGPCPDEYEEHDLFPEDDEPVRINPNSAGWLAELSLEFDLVWGSGWTAKDREVLPRVLELPPFAGAAKMPPIPFDPSEKVAVIADYVGSRACAWIDDLHTPRGIAWAAERVQPTLLVHADSAIGMTREHVDLLLDWAGSLTGNNL